MSRPTSYVVTTSYPEHAGDAQGHFVAAEVRRLVETHDVTVLAPGRARPSLFDERVVSLGGGDAFGFPGALARLRERPWRVAGAAQFVVSALRWLERAPTPAQLIAHFLLPCGVPIATRALGDRRTQLEIVVHGSDARLLAKLPSGVRARVGRELVSVGAQLRFVSGELHDLVLGALPARQREVLQARSRVAPCAIDLPGAKSRAQAREALGIAPDTQLAVIVARLIPGKRVHVALEACERVPDLRAVVVGEGPEREHLSQRFPRATFVGHVDRPLALTYLAAADALVSASLEEGAPTVVREARALGTPVVCLAAGDLASWAERDAGIHVVNRPPPATRPTSERPEPS
ncbi:MAG TPA: glycosyltransferase [Polyangiaceae bacterium]|nr:glycosyltransferase [Polyangiaceae bacterium]